MRRTALIAAAVLIPLIPAAPAYAADNVICVGAPAGVTCNQTVASIQTAITAANGNSVDDTIAVAPGTYNDGPYQLDGSAHHVTLQGSGQGSTFITLSSGGIQSYVTADHATVRDLTVTMNASSSIGDTGILAPSSSVIAVTVNGAGTVGANGMSLSSSTVSGSTVVMSLADASSTIGIRANGAPSTVTDTSIVACIGYSHSFTGGTDVLSRSSIRARFAGVTTEVGGVAVDDTLIDLGTGSEAAGLVAINDNNGSGSRSITANHVTIVGGGASSVGVGAYARAPGALQTSTVQLINSIVSGPVTDLYAEASNDGNQGANSTASITTSYSRWSTSQVLPGANGTATLTSGAGHLTAVPGFRNPALSDYRLAATSPLIDKGAPGTAAPTLDLAKGARILDGNADGVAVRDPGAYEAPKKADTTAPNTRFLSKPAKHVARSRVTFRFASNEAGSKFRCKLDRKPWRWCTSPRRVFVTVGWHTFRVRAIDRAGNADPTPAIYRFKRDR